MSKKTVVVDIDGVLADFEGRLDRTLSAKFGDRSRSDRSKYTMEERYAKDLEVLKYALDFIADPNSYYGLDECEGGINFVETLMDDGYKVLYVSARNESAYSITRRWLTKHTTDPDIMLQTGVQNKAVFLKEFGEEFDFVVDDSPSQIAKLKEFGFTAVVWHQPWNEGIFPRIYVRSDGEIMLWPDASIEAEPLFVADKD
jgi:beta-phosphoglucomutase-like phosphatase (HAD superfamily)